MIYLNVRHTVSDYAKWRTAFDDGATIRKTAGATGVNQIYRDSQNPGTVTAIMEWDNVEKARQHLADPTMKDVLQKAGVTGALEVSYLNRA